MFDVEVDKGDEEAIKPVVEKCRFLRRRRRLCWMH